MSEAHHHKPDPQTVAEMVRDKVWANDAVSQGLGMQIEVIGPGYARVTMTVRPDMVNGFGLCHGGVITTLADTAFAFACNAYDDLTFAAAASIDFLRPARLGDELQAIAREDYRGHKTGFYTVEVRNQRNENVALFRGRSASRGEQLL